MNKWEKPTIISSVALGRFKHEHMGECNAVLEIHEHSPTNRVPVIAIYALSGYLQTDHSLATVKMWAEIYNSEALQKVLLLK